MQNPVNKHHLATNTVTYLIWPNTLCSSKPSDTPSHLHVLVSGVHLPKAFTYVWHHPPEDLPAEDHSWPSHAEILSRLKPQFSEFFNIAQTSLSQVQRFTAVQWAKKLLQFFTWEREKIIVISLSILPAICFPLSQTSFFFFKCKRHFRLLQETTSNPVLHTYLKISLNKITFLRLIWEYDQNLVLFNQYWKKTVSCLFKIP